MEVWSSPFGPATAADAADVVRISVRTWQSAYAGIVPDDILSGLDHVVDERTKRTRERWSSSAPAIKALRSEGLAEIRLWVLTKNAPSRRFYERYGFRFDGQEHRDHLVSSQPPALP